MIFLMGIYVEVYFESNISKYCCQLSDAVASTTGNIGDKGTMNLAKSEVVLHFRKFRSIRRQSSEEIVLEGIKSRVYNIM